MNKICTCGFLPSGGMDNTAGCVLHGIRYANPTEPDITWHGGAKTFMGAYTVSIDGKPVCYCWGEDSVKIIKEALILKGKI